MEQQKTFQERKEEIINKIFVNDDDRRRWMLEIELKKKEFQELKEIVIKVGKQIKNIDLIIGDIFRSFELKNKLDERDKITMMKFFEYFSKEFPEKIKVSKTKNQRRKEREIDKRLEKHKNELNKLRRKRQEIGL